MSGPASLATDEAGQGWGIPGRATAPTIRRASAHYKEIQFADEANQDSFTTLFPARLSAQHSLTTCQPFSTSFTKDCSSGPRGSRPCGQDSHRTWRCLGADCSPLCLSVRLAWHGLWVMVVIVQETVANMYKEEMQPFARNPKCSSRYSGDVSWPLGKIMTIGIEHFLILWYWKKR